MEFENQWKSLSAVGSFWQVIKMTSMRGGRRFDRRGRRETVWCVCSPGLWSSALRFVVVVVVVVVVVF